MVKECYSTRMRTSTSISPEGSCHILTFISYLSYKQHCHLQNSHCVVSLSMRYALLNTGSTGEELSVLLIGM